jgi:preprotein translocase subunit SecE
MNAKADVQSVKSQSENLDMLKWVVSAVLLAAGFYGYHYFEQYPAAYRALGLLPIVALSLTAAVFTEKGNATWVLIREAFVEARHRVTWPTRQETTQTTLVVVAVVFVMALILWGLDAAFAKVVSLIIG